MMELQSTPNTSSSLAIAPTGWQIGPTNYAPKKLVRVWGRERGELPRPRNQSPLPSPSPSQTGIEATCNRVNSVLACNTNSLEAASLFLARSKKHSHCRNLSHTDSGTVWADFLQRALGAASNLETCSCAWGWLSGWRQKEAAGQVPPPPTAVSELEAEVSRLRAELAATRTATVATGDGRWNTQWTSPDWQQ